MEWISVADRLPEEADAYLVVMNDSVEFAEFSANGEWISFQMEDRIDPTHWMPIPPTPAHGR